MSDEQKGGFLELNEIIDVPLKLKINGTPREVKLLDNEALVELVSEVKQRLMRDQAEKAKTLDEIEAVKRKYQSFDMNVDQLASYCFTLEGSKHFLSLAMRRSGIPENEVESALSSLRRQLGAQQFASLAGDVSGIFPAQIKRKEKTEGEDKSENPNPTDMSTTGQKTSP